MPTYNIQNQISILVSRYRYDIEILPSHMTNDPKRLNILFNITYNKDEQEGTLSSWNYRSLLVFSLNNYFIIKLVSDHFS